MEVRIQDAFDDRITYYDGKLHEALVQIGVKFKKVWFVSQWDQVISSDFESLCISNNYKFENVALATKVELLEEVDRL